MFTLAVKRLDRTRGSGWLDCPYCHEHAAQDVVDRMTFLAGLLGGVIVVPLIGLVIALVTGYVMPVVSAVLLVLLLMLISFRYSPVQRVRLLRCRRCGYERPAGEHAALGMRLVASDEMRALDTAGEPIAKAWLFPVGTSLLLIVMLLFVAFIASSANTGPHGLQYVAKTATKVAPDVTLNVPNSWNFDVNADATPPFLSVSDTSGSSFQIVLLRDATTGDLNQLMDMHFRDQVGINDSGVPQTPPTGVCDTVGDTPAYKEMLNYQQAGQNAILIIYTFAHDGVGYVITFTATGDQGISDMKLIAEQVTKSVKFSGKETPAPSPSESPGATPTPTPTPTPSPSESASSSASASPNAVHC